MLWLKALHLIFMVTWFAGLFYLPRLFVYHSECGPNSEQSEIFKTMERRLLKAIMAPAMMVTWGLGLTLLFVFDAISLKVDYWFHAKIVLVILLTLFHIYLGKLAAEFAADNNRHDSKFYRMINEVPTVLMIAVVILVIVRPF
jgi:putative membrane protein